MNYAQDFIFLKVLKKTFKINFKVNTHQKIFLVIHHLDNLCTCDMPY